MFKNKKIIIQKEAISLNKKIINISFFELLNSTENQKSVFKNLTSIHIVLESELEPYHSNIKKMFDNNNIIIQKISLDNKKIVYHKKRTYQNVTLCIFSLTLCLISFQISTTNSQLQSIIQRKLKTITVLKKFQKNIANLNYSTYTEFLSLLDWLENNPIFIQHVHIQSLTLLKVIIFSYHDMISDKNQIQNITIRHLTAFDNGDYYEVSYKP
tara:strand:- start:595 stop:1233 length:639 start_codon:yes stop_codon:yes gene_type:complete